MASALTVPTKLAYGFGQFAEGVKNACFGVLLFFFYNQVLGVSGALVGIAVAIALAFDAITDPLAGSISDNWRSRYGRRHPFLLAAAIPLGVAFYLLFNPPEGLSEFQLFLWLTVSAVLTRGAMTLYHVPHLSLGAELSDNFIERTTVVAYRYFFSYVGVLVALGLAFGVFFKETEAYPRGQFNHPAYSPFALTMSVLMFVSIIATAIGTWHRIPELVQPDPNAPRVSPWGAMTRMFGDLVEALKSPSFAWLFVGVLVVFGMVGVDAALNLHMNTFFWELSSSGNFWFFAAGPIGVMVGASFAQRLNARFDKKPSIIFGTGAWTFCQVLPVVLRLVGWFPENGDEVLAPLLTFIKFVQGVCVAQALITFNSMLADIADEHELRTGRRQEGIFFAAVSFSSKTTTALGNMVAGFALVAIGWPASETVQVAADVPAETIQSLGFVYGPVLSGFVIVCLWCYSKYSIDRKRHQEIVAELAEKRAQAA